MAEAEVAGSRFISSRISVAGESAAAFEQFVDAAEVGYSRLVWCQKQANAQCGGVSQVAAARV